MKTRAELKAEARELLAGNWGKAILLNIISILGYLFLGTILLGAIGIGIWLAKQSMQNGGGGFTVDNTTTQSAASANNGGSLIGSLLSTFITVGVTYTTLNWLRTKNADFSPVRGMFSAFSKKYFVSTLVLYILQEIFVLLWSLLFIIPGIIKGFSYSQTYLIYKDVNENNEDNNLNYLDYITLSRELMNGHKMDLFVLQLSFIGWVFLGLATFGIGLIWVIPYYQTTMVAFYKDLAGDRFLNYRG
ncbi:DUF975 family protein [Ligilactobacillus faecis]|uniref:DUF975 family protein n=1 Tax=Ligilactobacillus faecis TaxID=762833 RepID=A0ABV4DRA3_9LACO